MEKQLRNHFERYSINGNGGNAGGKQLGHSDQDGVHNQNLLFHLISVLLSLNKKSSILHRPEGFSEILLVTMT